MSELLDVLPQAVGIQTLEGADDRPVQRLSALRQEAPVGDVVGQGVLEHVLELGKQARLVHELRSLQAPETPPEGFLVQSGHREEQRECHVGPDDGHRL